MDAPGLALKSKKDGLEVGSAGVGARGRLRGRSVSGCFDFDVFSFGHYTDAMMYAYEDADMNKRLAKTQDKTY